MSLAFAVYLIAISGSLKSLLIPLGVITLILTFFYNALAVGVGNTERSYDKQWKSRIWPVFVAVPVLIIAALIPSRQDSYAIAAAYAVQKVAENPRVQTFASNSLAVLEKNMNDFLKEEKPVEQEKTKEDYKKEVDNLGEQVQRLTKAMNAYQQPVVEKTNE